MRQVVIVVCVMLFAAVVAARAPAPAAPDVKSDENLSQGQFAQLMLRAIATKTQAEASQLPPEKALARVKELELVPAEWTAERQLTQRDLADVLVQLGIDYQPADPAAPVSRAFVEALLRRYQLRFEQYGQMKFTHGQSRALITDEGVDRAVSPSQF